MICGQTQHGTIQSSLQNYIPAIVPIPIGVFVPPAGNINYSTAGYNLELGKDIAP